MTAFGPQPEQFRGQRGGFGRRHPAHPAAQQDAGFAFVGRKDVDALEKVARKRLRRRRVEHGSGAFLARQRQGRRHRIERRFQLEQRQSRAAETGSMPFDLGRRQGVVGAEATTIEFCPS